MTMFMAAVIITVGIAFNWLVKEHMRASEALKIKSESILKARSAYDTLVYLLLSGSLSQREIRIDAPDEISLLTRIPVDGQKVSLAPDIFIQVQDSNGKLSLTTVNQYAMERLIRTVGGGRFPPRSSTAISTGSMRTLFPGSTEPRNIITAARDCLFLAITPSSSKTNCNG